MKSPHSTSPFHIGQRMFDVMGCFSGVAVQITFDARTQEHESLLDSGWWYTAGELSRDIGSIGQRKQGKYANDLTLEEVYHDYDRWQENPQLGSL